MPAPLQFGHFDVLTDELGVPIRLGLGGMGTTFRAYDRHLRRNVALKIINERLLAETSSRRRFFNEARAAALIDHPNVARVIYLCPEDAPECFFAMELVEGESLASRIARHGPLPPGEALLLLRAVADALGALGEHRLVHRDIKPENVMIASARSSASRVKLIDFGLAKALEHAPGRFESVQTGEHFVGSVYFASPEQIRPRGTLDSRSDFYSLGATLWHVLTGFPPFTGTVFEVQEGHVYHDPPWEKIAELPPAVHTLLRRLLAKEPSQRPADAPALLAEWDVAIADLEVSASAAGRPLARPAPGGALPLTEVEQAPADGGSEAQATVVRAAERPRQRVAPPTAAPAPPQASRAQLGASPLPAHGKSGKARALAVLTLVLLAASAAGWWLGVERPRRESQRAEPPAVNQVEVVTPVDETAKAEEAMRRSVAAAQEEEQHRAAEAARKVKIADGLSEAAAALEAKDVAKSRERYQAVLVLDDGNPKAVAGLAKVKEVELAQASGLELARLKAADEKQRQEAARIAAEKAPHAGQPYENSLGMKFVPLPQSRVLFSVWETRVKDFAAYVEATSYDATGGVFSLRNGRWEAHGDSWRNPGFAQTEDHPVCAVNWFDAVAFCEWLTAHERARGAIGRETYRLPTDKEWTAAAGAAEYPWGSRWPPTATDANLAGREAKNEGVGTKWEVIESRTDPYARTSPVGSFAPNALGIFDLAGNVWEWCAELFPGKADSRIIHGGSWFSYEKEFLRTQHRGDGKADSRGTVRGFRVVLALPASG